MHSSTTVINNTIVENLGHGVNLCSGTVKNNIIANNFGKGIYGAANNSYNCLWLNKSGSFFDNHVKTGDIYANPLFIQPGEWMGLDTPDPSDDIFVRGDYHLQSEYGRWNPMSESWNHDTPGHNSPCIDAGDPISDWKGELWPHGKRINQGVYGNTHEASMSDKLYDGNIADLDNDGMVNLHDWVMFSQNWTLDNPLIPANLDRSAKVDEVDLMLFVNEWLKP